MVSSRGPWRWLRWVIAAVVVIIVLAVGGPFVFFHFIEGNGPAPLSLKASPAASASGTQSAGSQGASASQGGSGSVAGTWAVGSGSRVGYRVNEVSPTRPSAAAAR